MKNPVSMAVRFGRSPEFQNWTLLFLFVFLLKIVLFAVDPLPKFIMGDSGTYLWTALHGGIPEDRSFFYGYVIRWISVGPESLTSLMIVQASLSAVVSVLLALICRVIFRLPLLWSCLCAILCALDPLQLLYERYVMTETISLFFYAIALSQVFLYLGDHRLRNLIFLQVISILLVGFRMSYLPLVEIDTFLLPVLAFSGSIWRALRQPSGNNSLPRWPALRVCGGHLLLSVMLMFALHTGYKRLNGFLSHREPAYVYATGVTLLAFWSPALEPGDSPNPELADLIRRGKEMGLKERRARNGQLFSPEGLIERIFKLQPDRAKADDLAKQTAFHALVRDPLGVLGLTWYTYADYWSVTAMKDFLEKDFSFYNPPGGDLIQLLAINFHLAQNNTTAKTFLQSYYVAGWPYYFLVLLTPLLSALAILLKAGRPYAILLFVHSSIIMGVAMTFGSETMRFLQPVSFLTLLIVALWITAALKRLARNKAGAAGEPIQPGDPAQAFPFSPI
jgi:hypothetical protein